MPTTFTTVRGVPLAKVGDWPTFKGNGTITRQNLADAVAASKDQEIRAALDGDPRGWLGHVDGQDAAAARQNEPAVGRVTNLSLSDDGDTLIGDVEDIPQAVVDHYPWRSVELQPNIETTAGKTYSRVLTGLAHLGRVRGAVRGLGALDDIVKGLDATPVLAASAGEPILFQVGPTDPAPTGTPLEAPAPASTVSAMDTQTADATAPAAEAEDTQPVVEETTDETTTDEAQAEPTDAPKHTPAEPAGPETVTVTKAIWDQTQARLDALETDKTAREAAARDQERDLAIAAALKDGRIAPADKDSTVALFAEHGNAAGLALLTRLPKGKVPTEEIGTNGTGSDEYAAADSPSIAHLTHAEAVQLGYIKES